MEIGVARGVSACTQCATGDAYNLKLTLQTLSPHQYTDKRMIITSSFMHRVK